MPVPLENFICLVCFKGNSLWFKYSRPSAEPHGTAEFAILYLVSLVCHDIYDRMFGALIYFCRVGTFETENGPCVFDNCQLHTVTESEVRNLVLSDKFYRADDTFHSRDTKPAGYNDSVVTFELTSFTSATFIFFGIDPYKLGFDILPKRRKFDCFDDRNVGIREQEVSGVEIFTDHRDFNFLLGRPGFRDECLPGDQIHLAGLEVKVIKNLFT